MGVTYHIHCMKLSQAKTHCVLSLPAQLSTMLPIISVKKLCLITVTQPGKQSNHGELQGQYCTSCCRNDQVAREPLRQQEEDEPFSCCVEGTKSRNWHLAGGFTIRHLGCRAPYSVYQVCVWTFLVVEEPRSSCNRYQPATLLFIVLASASPVSFRGLL